MARKSKPRRPVPFGEPHHWAYLSEWRDLAGLTQEGAAAALSVSGVTIHRWETGKAPVTTAVLVRLAGLYGASDIGMLSLPPPELDKIVAIREAWRIILALPAAQRADWLAHGRVLALAHASREKLHEV